MSNLEIIKEILNHKYLANCQDKLCENNNTAKGKTFNSIYPIVRKRDIEHLLFKYDQEAFPFFKDVSGLKKMCDYILFAEENNFLYVFVIELKLSNESAQKQLDAANEFAKFLVHSANRIGKTIVNAKIRKIRICDSKTKKRNLKVEKGFEFDKNNYCDYQQSKLYLEPLMQY